jgi:hypothetical protein
MSKTRYAGLVVVVVVVGILAGSGMGIAGAAPTRVATPPADAPDAVVLAEGTGACTGTDLCTTVSMAYTVPAGKELVLQESSFHATVQPGQDLQGVDVNTNAGFANWIAPQHETTDELGDTSIVGSTAGTYYAAPGQRVYCEFRRNATAGDMSAECTLNGYLVTVR